MQNLARISKALVDAGIEATGVSALHDTGSPAVFVFADDLVYRIDLGQPLNALQIKIVEAAIKDVTGASIIESAPSRSQADRDAAVKAHLAREAAIATKDTATEQTAAAGKRGASAGQRRRRHKGSK
jgi:hypothetical protein